MSTEAGQLPSADIRAVSLSKAWVQEQRRWGETSPLWVAKVLGEFPDRSDNCLIPYSMIQRARERDLTKVGPPELGVDVAHLGTDSTVIVERWGDVYRVVSCRQGDNTMETTGVVANLMLTEGVFMAKIDGIGVGAGVIDRMREQDLTVISMIASRRANEPVQFLNARAEWYWWLRERFERGLMDIDPNDEELAEQLASIRFKRLSSGKIQIETKDDMRRRGLSSPDRADALMLAAVDIYLTEPFWTQEDEEAYERDSVHISDY